MKRGLFRRQKGQGLVEYALIIVLIAIVVIVALRALGPTVRRVFTRISLELENPGQYSGPPVSVSSISVTFTGQCGLGYCSTVTASATVSLVDDEGQPMSAQAHVQFVNSYNNASVTRSGTGTIDSGSGLGDGQSGNSVQACVVAVEGHTLVGGGCHSVTY